MKKKLTIMLIATLVFAAVFGATAYAASARDIVSGANASIAQEIDKAVAQACQATAAYNNSIAWAKACGGSQAARQTYDNRLDQISATLIYKTNQISHQAITDCAGLGVTVHCEYIPVTLGDRVVWVDPLVIIG